jgi:pyruvate,water dikinase
MSLFSPRALFYRHEKGMTHLSISMAVVVQAMVEPEYAGVAFSVHPVTEDMNTLVLEAVQGLGEQLVSGEVTPDSYVVDKRDCSVIDMHLSGDMPLLTDELLEELAAHVINIEKFYGFPCDIEWAVKDEAVYILQSRPITTLSS